MRSAFVLLALLAGALAILVLVEMLFMDGWRPAIQGLAALELVVVPALVFRHRAWLQARLRARRASTLILLVAACAGFPLVGAPYVFLANALVPSGEVVRFAGPVATKRVGRAKGGQFQVVRITDARSGRAVDILADRQEFDAAATGREFSRCMSVGGLGLAYRWRFGVPPSCEG